MKKEPIDPKFTKAYNHYPIDGDKEVIPNVLFKEALQSNCAYTIKYAMGRYALDKTQKNLLTDKLNQLEKDLPPL